MNDETLGEIAEKDIEVDAKIIIQTTLGSKVKMILTQNLQGELDFINRHFTVPRNKKIESEIRAKIERITSEYINVKKNAIIDIELIRKNKHDLKNFKFDCIVNVSNDKSIHGKREKFMSVAEITKTSKRKSLAVINTLVYYTEGKNKL